MTKIQTKFIFRIEFWRLKHESDIGAIAIVIALLFCDFIASLLPRKMSHANRVTTKPNRVHSLRPPPGSAGGEYIEFEEISDTPLEGFTITCKNCGKQAVKKSKRAMFCSDACRYEFHNKKRQSR